MNIPESASRWHLVLSKYPCSASETKELTVHGALAQSNVMVTGPLVVESTYLMVPLVGTPVAVGGTTSRAAFPDAEYSQMSPPPTATGVALDVGDCAAEVAAGLGIGG